MTQHYPWSRRVAFSLVEVVLAVGIIGISVLATVALLSVGSDTNKKARDEAFAAQLVANELERLRSLSLTNFSTTYAPRFFDADLANVPDSDKAAKAIYELRLAFVDPATGTVADLLVNAEIRYPANASATNQSVFYYTTLMNKPKS